MRASNRITTINAGGSDGWEILYRARAMKRAGQRVLDLTVGDHDRTTPALILDAMDAGARGGHTGYSDIAGIPALRDAVAARVTARTGVATSRQNVLITPGGQSALFSAFMAVLDPGDTALVCDPYYATYPGTVRATSGIAVALPMRAEAGFQPQRRDLDAAPPACALLINTPNNPTGAVYSAQTMATLADFARDRDLWLISDEVYDTQVWEGAHLSPRALPGMADRVLVVGSLSKSHMMTGSRIGWLIGPEAMIAHLTDLATNTTYGVPGFIQDAAVAALRDGAAVEAEVTALYAGRRAVAQAAIAGANSVRMVPSGGAMYLMLDIRATGLGGTEFAAQLLERHAIAVMPGESFGKAAAGHVRVALTASGDALTEALTTLARFAHGAG